jgi:hypothetical protein
VFSHGWPLSTDGWDAQMVPPLKTPSNPGGLPMDVFDGFRKAVLTDRALFFRDIPAGPFYGFNRPGTKVSHSRRALSRGNRRTNSEPVSQPQSPHLASPHSKRQTRASVEFTYSSRVSF